MENIEHFYAITKKFHIVLLRSISIIFNIFDYLFRLAVLVNIQICPCHDLSKENPIFIFPPSEPFVPCPEYPNFKQFQVFKKKNYIFPGVDQLLGVNQRLRVTTKRW